MSQQFARTPREALDQQLQELATLRNAGTRAPQFKAWRQATLTLIQRIFSNDPSRSERFRRIPFTPAGNKTELRDLREGYEKGCAEAMFYLRDLRDKVGERDWSDLERGGERDDFEVGSTEDDFPTLELPPSDASRAAKRPAKPRPAAPPPPAPSAAAPPTRSSLLNHLLREAEAPTRPSLPPPLPAEESRVIPPDRVRPQRERPKAASGIKKKGRGLMDLLGFGSSKNEPEDVEPVVAEPPPPLEPPPAPPPAPKQGPTLQEMLLSADFRAKLEGGQDLEEELRAAEEVQQAEEYVEELRDEFAEEPAPEELVEEDYPEEVVEEAAQPVYEIDDPVEPEPADVEPEPLEPFADEPDLIEANSATEDFLRNSPVLSSQPRAVRRPGAEGDGPGFRTPEAREIAKIAARVADFGVPEGQRVLARAALGELARNIEGLSLTWETLREAIAFLMNYPALARRVLPLLLPFLDDAA